MDDGRPAPRKTCAPDADAITHRLAVRLDEVEEAVLRIDHDRARRFLDGRRRRHFLAVELRLDLGEVHRRDVVGLFLDRRYIWRTAGATFSLSGSALAQPARTAAKPAITIALPTGRADRLKFIRTQNLASAAGSSTYTTPDLLELRDWPPQRRHHRKGLTERKGDHENFDKGLISLEAHYCKAQGRQSRSIPAERATKDG